jgi:hypothetical protein
MENKYYVRYQGVVMTMADFARLCNVDYDTLRKRARTGKDLFSPIREDDKSRFPEKKASKKTHGYSLGELAEMYSRFRGDEEELVILADLACLRRGSKEVVELKKEIEKYLYDKRKEVSGK